MAQWAKELSTKPDNLFDIPSTPHGERKEPTLAHWPLTSRYLSCGMRVSTPTHKQANKQIKIQEEITASVSETQPFGNHISGSACRDKASQRGMPAI